MSKQVGSLIVRTHLEKWVIPCDRDLLKALLNLKGLKAKDLVFSSKFDCQEFIRELALLATSDELTSGQPSPLSQITRQLLARQFVRENAETHFEH